MRTPTFTRSLRAAIGVVAASAFALAGGSAAIAKAAGEFTDPLGDSSGAPDILGVTAENDARGELSIFVLLLGGSVVAPGEDVQVSLVLDTDKNEATGSDGFDYVFQYDARTNTHAVGKWDGTQFNVSEAPSAAVNWSPLSVWFKINRSDLGGTTAFDFFIRSHRDGPESGLFDDAPNDGVWSYTYAAPASIAKMTFASAPSARAGKVLDARRVRLQLSDGTSVVPERLTCRLAAGGAVLRPLAGGCRWRIPTRLKGKTVVLTLVAGYGADELKTTRRLVVRN